jgi:hypothetical protein
VHNIIDENTFFRQIIEIKNKLTNNELKLFQFFYEQTDINLVNLIVDKNYIFCFVSQEDYFLAKRSIAKLRYKISKYKKKILIIRAEKTLIRLIFTLFQDTYIHDVRLILNNSNKIIILLEFLNEQDKIIAVGNKGSYIKTVNTLIDSYLSYHICSKISKKIPIEIKCGITKLCNPV